MSIETDLMYPDHIVRNLLTEEQVELIYERNGQIEERLAEVNAFGGIPGFVQRELPKRIESNIPGSKEAYEFFLHLDYLTEMQEIEGIIN